MFSLYDISADVPDPDQKAVTTVRRINERWIVRGLLRENATAYLHHLEQTDPARLIRTCHAVLGLIKHHHAELDDPKALFYSALFSMATREEIKRFLSEHYLTCAVASLLRGNFDNLVALPPAARPKAETLARSIREYLAGQVS